MSVTHGDRLAVEAPGGVAAVPPALPYDADKAPDQIEEDIERTRADLSETLKALERKLAPRQLLEQGMDMLRGTMTDTHGPLSDTLRNNPVPLALIGVGLGWMLWSSTGRPAHGTSGQGVGMAGITDRLSGAASSIAGSVSAGASSAVQSVKEAVGMGGDEQRRAGGDIAYARTKSAVGPGSGTMGAGAMGVAPVGVAPGGTGSTSGGATAGGAAGGGMAEGAAEALGRARETGARLAGQAGDYAAAVGGEAREVASQAGEQVRRVGDRLGRAMQDHPLMVGGLAVLAGTVLGMMLPASRPETEFLGEAGEAMREQVAVTGRDVVNRASAVAERVAEVARDEVGKEFGSAEEGRAEARKADEMPGHKPV